MCLKLGLIYLACPYSHKDSKVRNERVHSVNKAAGHLLKNGYLVYSPISMSHNIALDCNLESDYISWEPLDTEMLTRCDSLVILLLEGWTESRGVRAEYDLATSLGKPIYMMTNYPEYYLELL